MSCIYDLVCKAEDHRMCAVRCSYLPCPRDDITHQCPDKFTECARRYELGRKILCKIRKGYLK